MAASSAVQNPPTDNKASKKKKAKAAEQRTESPAPPVSPAPEKAADGADELESPYVRELQKNIRNLNKKITNASKTDSLIAEHKGASLDELIALKVINADQKAQHLKKPALLAQLAQLEDQLAQYRKVESEYKARLATEKAELEKTLTEKLEREKEAAVAEVRETTAAASTENLRTHLLLVSQFLRLAAARRAEEADQSLDENQALEGVLLAIYNGDDKAVDTMLKLVAGAEEKTHDTTFEPLQTTFSQIKALAQAHKVAYTNESQLIESDTAAAEAPATDPTVANAGLTEITAGEDTVLTNGHAEVPDTKLVSNAEVADAAANEAGESQWDDAGNNMSMSMSQDWVDVSVPRDPAETETGLEATPAAPANTQSWADDQPEPAAEAPAPADPNDGFHQVQGRNRGREHGWRGRGRGEWRGRGGYRGEGRGRGRGGRGRGDGSGTLPTRGPRRAEES